MSWLNSAKNLFRKTEATIGVVTFSGSQDLAEIPTGWFRVETLSGKKSLGYYDPATGFLSWDVAAKPIVVRDGVRVELDPKDLPLVKLNFPSAPTSGAQRVGGLNFIDSDDLENFNGEFTWAGEKPKDGWL